MPTSLPGAPQQTLPACAACSPSSPESLIPGLAQEHQRIVPSAPRCALRPRSAAQFAGHRTPGPASALAAAVGDRAVASQPAHIGQRMSGSHMHVVDYPVQRSAMLAAMLA